MMKTLNCLGWALMALAAVPAARAAPTGLPPASSAALACLILPDQVADIGSQVVGVMEWVGVERGDRIQKGQVVARLRADVERASTTVARSRADSEGDLRGAVAQRDLARLKLDRASGLAQQNYVSAQAVEQARTEFAVANERVALARENLRTTTREVSVSQAQLSQRVMRSPIGGVVVERYLNPGERVEDKPVLKVAHIETLRVEVVAPVALFGVLRLGQTVSVQPDLPGSTARTASVTQIDKVLDPASNTFRVRLSLPNPDEALPAGLRCRVDLGAAQPGAERPLARQHQPSPSPAAR
jgi:membrane fusion protein, heavy metal efflux system